jgi:hypothetical protein
MTHIQSKRLHLATPLPSNNAPGSPNVSRVFVSVRGAAKAAGVDFLERIGKLPYR